MDELINDIKDGEYQNIIIISGAGVMDTIAVPKLSLEASSLAQIGASPSPYNNQNMVEVSFALDGAQDETEIVISGDVWGASQGKTFAVGGFSQISKIQICKKPLM